MNSEPGQQPRGVWAWALYDWANSAFATSVLVAFFPVFFARYWGESLSGQQSTFWLGIGSAIASLLVALLSPALGAAADQGGFKKRLLAVMTALGAAGTAALCWIGPGAWGWAMTAFVVAQVGFALGISFYDALIVHVCPPEARHRVSALGYALGYLGGGLLLVLHVVMTLHPAWFGLPDTTAAVRVAFASVAVWWVIFSLPLFRRVQEPRPQQAVPWWSAAVAGVRELLTTLRRVRSYPQVWTFLIAYWLYIDGVHTIARMAVDYGAKLGFETNALIQALVITQFVGFPATLIMARFAGRIGTRNALFAGILVYVGVTLWGFFLQTEAQFYIMAAVIGLVQGAVQALSRSYYSVLIPADRAGEFFGFYNMMGKFAAVLGPVLVGVSAVLTGSSRVSILSILILFVGGMVCLARVRGPGERTR